MSKAGNARWDAANPENGKRRTAKSRAKAFIKNATSDDDLKFVEEQIEKKWNGDEIK